MAGKHSIFDWGLVSIGAIAKQKADDVHVHVHVHEHEHVHEHVYEHDYVYEHDHDYEHDHVRIVSMLPKRLSF